MNNKEQLKRIKRLQTDLKRLNEQCYGKSLTTAEQSEAFGKLAAIDSNIEVFSFHCTDEKLIKTLESISIDLGNTISESNLDTFA